MYYTVHIPLSVDEEGGFSGVLISVPPSLSPHTPLTPKPTQKTTLIKIPPPPRAARKTGSDATTGGNGAAQWLGSNGTRLRVRP